MPDLITVILAKVYCVLLSVEGATHGGKICLDSQFLGFIHHGKEDIQVGDSIQNAVFM